MKKNYLLYFLLLALSTPIWVSCINGKTKCSTFTKHFVLSLALLTQNKMCILSPLNML